MKLIWPKLQYCKNDFDDNDDDNHLLLSVFSANSLSGK